MCDLSVIILCGGLGTRLRSKIGNETPKLLAPIGDNCFLDYLLQWIDDSLDEISYELIFCLGYGSRKIEDKIKSTQSGVIEVKNVKYIKETIFSKQGNKIFFYFLLIYITFASFLKRKDL